MRFLKNIYHKLFKSVDLDDQHTLVPNQRLWHTDHGVMEVVKIALFTEEVILRSKTEEDVKLRYTHDELRSEWGNNLDVVSTWQSSNSV